MILYADFRIFICSVLFLVLGLILLVLLFAARRNKDIARKAFMSIEEEEASRPSTLFLGLSFVLLGLVPCVFCFFPSLGRYADSAMSGCLSLLTFYGAFYFGISLPLRCKQRVSGRCVAYTSGIRGFASPRFALQWEGKELTFTALACVYQLKKLTRLYSINCVYSVFINPDRPRELICHRRFGGVAILYAAFGLFFLLGALLPFLP